eukprot:CAMPEP_0116571104 /NCGR_PEP_ID=MMETSP0397-20121206/17359_1 /TAXON_ID=216820 /ORGANISM="Cyclophora tenuis, Strain ECT3854" /LENGTH=43 /DNA_ID= /DNA_START= /DNA_END= /DNA_ORIENTATION=
MATLRMGNTRGQARCREDCDEEELLELQAMSSQEECPPEMHWP